MYLVPDLDLMKIRLGYTQDTLRIHHDTQDTET